jgi:hypothetical protein
VSVPQRKDQDPSRSRHGPTRCHREQRKNHFVAQWAQSSGLAEGRKRCLVCPSRSVSTLMVVNFIVSVPCGPWRRLERAESKTSKNG